VTGLTAPAAELGRIVEFFLLQIVFERSVSGLVHPG
jgi:hypothetical protein